mmetsp:Transcript_112538/g.312863  ORF Transcript_112538/g.312863 Transcript_112538/m.312863 type:complete len:115 (-) Transcript_112538:220-564(-)
MHVAQVRNASGMFLPSSNARTPACTMCTKPSAHFAGVPRAHRRVAREAVVKLGAHRFGNNPMYTLNFDFFPNCASIANAAAVSATRGKKERKPAMTQPCPSPNSTSRDASKASF